MTDYDYWRDALNGKCPEIHADHPCSGYYSLKDPDSGAIVPVAIWFNRGTGRMIAKKGYNAVFELVDPLDIWTYIADRPVSYEAYHECTRTHSWPNEKSSDFQRLLAVLNSYLAVPEDMDGGELEDFAIRFESARKKENQPLLEAKRIIDKKYQGVLDRIRDALKTLKQAEERSCVERVNGS